MDDQFFTKLREIQKKERANSSLARVGNDFYKRTHKYLDSIRDIAVNDPFSQESDLLKNVQRIATEICEIREHKIADAAVMNIHRSYHLFQGKPQFDLVDTTPLNITEEEEALYFSFIDVLKSHRRSISLDQLTADESNSNESTDISTNNEIDNSSSSTNNSSNNQETNNNSNNNYNNNHDKIDQIDKSDVSNDQVLNRLNKIKTGKVIEDESYESIEKQIIKSKNSNADINQINPENSAKHPNSQVNSQTNSQVNSKVSPKSSPEISPKTNSQEETESSAIYSSNSKNKNNIDNSNKTANIDDDSNSIKNNNSANIESNIGADSRDNGPANVGSKISSRNTKNNINSGENKSINPKSEFSNIMANENEQFVDLDHLNQDIVPNLDANDFNRNKSRSTADRIVNVMVLIFSEINSIIGVDKKVYGPFQPQDIVVMPDINAKILIKSKKGRLVKI